MYVVFPALLRCVASRWKLSPRCQFTICTVIRSNVVDLVVLDPQPADRSAVVVRLAVNIHLPVVEASTLGRVVDEPQPSDGAVGLTGSSTRKTPPSPGRMLRLLPTGSHKYSASVRPSRRANNRHRTSSRLARTSRVTGSGTVMSAPRLGGFGRSVGMIGVVGVVGRRVGLPRVRAATALCVAGCEQGGEFGDGARRGFEVAAQVLTASVGPSK